MVVNQPKKPKRVFVARRSADCLLEPVFVVEVAVGKVVLATNSLECQQKDY